jgi:hypothetical protein
MKRHVWTPIDEYGVVNQEELTLPDRTASPTLYEIHFNGDKAQLAAVYAKAMVRHHTFRIVTSRLDRMEPTDMFTNVRVAAGPFQQPHTAEHVIASLLRFPTSYREVILAPTAFSYAFDLFRLCSTGRDTDRDHIRYTDALSGYTYDGSYSKDEQSAYTRHGRLDRVLVRGDGVPLHVDHVRLIRDQAANSIGVEKFSLDWGAHLPREALLGGEVSQTQPIFADRLPGMLDGVWLGEER